MENLKEKYNNTVVHCPTLEIAEKVEEKIIKIHGKHQNIAEQGFGSYKDQTCFIINTPLYGSKYFFEKENYIVLTAEDFLNKSNEIVDNYSIC